MIYFFFSSNKTKTFKLLALILIVILGYFLFDHLSYKFNEVSYLRRINSILYAMDMVSMKPLFGWGYYYGCNETNVFQQAIGLIGVSYQIGIIGILFFFIPLYIKYTQIPRVAILVFFPLLGTILFLQPDINLNLLYLLLLIDYKSLNENET